MSSESADDFIDSSKCKECNCWIDNGKLPKWIFDNDGVCCCDFNL